MFLSVYASVVVNQKCLYLDVTLEPKSCTEGEKIARSRFCSQLRFANVSLTYCASANILPSFIQLWKYMFPNVTKNFKTKNLNNNIKLKSIEHVIHVMHI